MKNKVAIIAVAAAFLLLANGIAAYAHPGNGGRNNNSRPSQPSWPSVPQTQFPAIPGYNRVAPRFPQMVPPRVNTSPRENTSMSVYEQYGLSYDKEKNGYYYNGKKVGLFADSQNRRFTFLSFSGEIHLKAIRSITGNLTGLSELSKVEYDEIIAQMDKKRAEFRSRMEKMFPQKRSR